MENSKRLDNVFKQLNKYNLHSNVKIQYNKGFKNCNKILKQQTSAYDLTDALRNIFEDAKECNYNNILVLEDDFIIDNNKFKLKDIQRISQFVNSNNFHVYNLGTLFHFSVMYKNRHHLKNLFNCLSHAVIYNKNYFKPFITSACKGDIKHCDVFWNKRNIKSYSYHKPIIFQTFPETDNMKEWPMWKVSKNWFKLWKLDKSHKNYQSHSKFIYIISYTLIFLLILSIIIVCIISNKRKKV